MDPLSLTASIIAVLGAIGSISNGLQKLSSLHHAPMTLLALNNEISDLQLIIRMTHDLLQDQENIANADSINPSEYLRPLLVRAKDKLLELDMLIHYRLTASGRNGEVELNGLTWTREHRRLRLFKTRFVRLE